MDDASLLQGIAPSIEDRIRNIDINNISLPAYDNQDKGFRYDGVTAGKKLTGHKVFANHFAIDTSLVPERFYQYHIHILRKTADGYSPDCVADEDLKTCVEALTLAKEQNPQWFLPQTGVAYDGRSALFSTKPLQLHDVNEVKY